MAMKAARGKGRPIGSYGKFIHGGNSMQDASKVICLISWRRMDGVLDKNPSTKRNYSFLYYMQVIKLCDQITLEDREKISKLYLHNFSLTYLNLWESIQS